jgi:hypothetical protein
MVGVLAASRSRPDGGLNSPASSGTEPPPASAETLATEPTAPAERPHRTASERHQGDRAPS